MTTEKAVRRRASFIWSAAASRPCLITSVRIGSASLTPVEDPAPARTLTTSVATSALPSIGDEQVARLVHLELEARVDVGGCGLLEHDRRPGDRGPGRDRIAVENGERHALAACERVGVDGHVVAAGGLRAWPGRLSRQLPSCGRANGDDLEV